MTTNGHAVSVLEQPGAEWTSVESEQLAAGQSLALYHRVAWTERTGPHWLVVARDSEGRVASSFAVELRRPRAVPGHRILRVQHLGVAPDREALRRSLSALRNRVASDGRALELHVATYAIQREPRLWLDQTLAELGFARRRRPESYVRTSLLDLRHDEASLLARTSTMARRNIRRIQRQGLQVIPLTDSRHVDRMRALVVETRRRTRGTVPRRSLSVLLELARVHPDLVRVVGLFPAGSDQLLAFASGVFHGDHVVYGDGASTRDSSLHVPLGYGLIWDLVLWARSVGATWFDLGGITDGTKESSDDPLGGISDFKRQFRGAVGLVGEEWSFTPRPIRAAFASRMASLARGMLRV